MNPTIIFTSAIISLTALYLSYAHVRKRRKLRISRVFAFFSLIICAEYATIGLRNSPIEIMHSEILVKMHLFLPMAGLIMLTVLLLIYPIKKPVYWKLTGTLLFLLAAGDGAFIFLTSYSTEIINSTPLTITESIPAMIHTGMLALAMLLVPVIIIIRIRLSRFRRIQYTLKLYLRGILCFYISFIAIHFGGFFLYGISITDNALLALPVGGVLLTTHHLVFRLRSSDFKYFYTDVFILFIVSIMLFSPVYIFLKYEKIIPSLAMFTTAVKAVVFFIYFAVVYRLFSPLINRFRKKYYNQVLENINRIIIPIDDLKLHADSDSFWNMVARDSIKGLKDSLGIINANFMLYNKMDNGYYLSYGYGPGINMDFIPSDSPVITTMSKIEGVFGKSYFRTDYNFSDSPVEAINFFHDNKIEVAMLFRNMSDTLIGFLFLGEFEGRRPYTSAHIDALEIYRIKLQNLLTTGLILDEVMSDQIKDHDKLVIRKIKDKIIPEKIYSIPNIRISSMSMDNSDFGGDYFDSVRLSADKLSIFISDLSYSGIDSALLGLELYSILHSRSFVFSSPEKMLNMMNQVIKSSSITNNHVPCSSIVIDSNGNFHYSSASYNAMLVYDPDKNDFMEIQSSSIPVGIEMDYRYQLTAGKLRDGSLGFLYSDGLISSCNTAGETFSIDRVKDTIVKYARENPAVVLREIFNSYNSFTESRNQINDVSAILFKKVKADDE